jgi:hypothetical protein
MVCELCGKTEAYHFHDNAPAYCPHCKQYLLLKLIDKVRERSKKLSRIMEKMKNKQH